MEAMVLVNEEVPGPKVTDEEKYEEILNQRKERKAVSVAWRFDWHGRGQVLQFQIFKL